MSFGIPVRNGLGVGLLASTFLSSRRAAYPAMSLDFLQPFLDSRITFSRGTAATRVNASGFIETVGTTTPRFDYDPVTLAPKGLLIEEARTNLLTYSAQFDNAYWTKGNATITANSTAAPDGTITADTLVSAASTAATYVQTTVTPTAAAHTLTVYVKASGARFVQLLWAGSISTDFANFDLTLGTVTAGTYTSASITNAASGWYRISITSTLLAAVGAANVYLVDSGAAARAATFTGNGTSGIYLYGAQLEAGSFATSYIPTVASTVTRSADVATMTGTNFSSWYNQSEGTFVANYSAYAADAVSTKAIVSANDGTGNNRIYMYLATNAAPTELVNNGGVTQATVSNAAIANGAVTKSAMIYRTDDFAIGTNGGTLATDTLGTVPTVTQLTIGNSSSISQLNGHIRQIAYYNTRLPNAQLQTLTAPSLATTLSLSFTNQAYTVGV